MKNCVVILVILASCTYSKQDTAEAAPWAVTINMAELPKFMLVDYVKVFSSKINSLKR